MKYLGTANVPSKTVAELSKPFGVSVIKSVTLPHFQKTETRLTTFLTRSHLKLLLSTQKSNSTRPNAKLKLTDYPEHQQKYSPVAPERRCIDV